MRMALRTKILGSFALIVLLALGTAVGAGNRLTRIRFDDYSYRRDVARASFLATVMADWMTRTGGGTGMLPPFTMEPPQAPEGLQGERRGAMRMMDRMAGRHGIPGPMAVDRMVVTDAEGTVLLDTTGDRRRIVPPGRYENAVIRNGSDVLGYLYVGRMIPDSNPRDDVSFFRAVGAATWGVAAAVFTVAMTLGVLLTRHIVGPVTKLNAAARSVGKGDLSVRVPSERRDELGELSRAFNAMTSSLGTAEERRRRFIADSAHELRTPVSLIRTRIEMMEEGIYPLDRKGLDALSAETERLNGLVEQLRTLATLDSGPSGEPNGRESGGPFDDAAAVNLTELAREAVSAAEPALRRGSILAEVIEEGDPPDIRGDRDGLYSLVANLLSNAVRHAASKVLVRIEAEPAGPGGGKRIRLAVEDDGAGIPEEHRSRVFERYYRVDASRSRAAGGSGLGLAICLGIVRNHGGSIRAGESESLGGARFEADLPA